jgi:hypothetical protein
MKMEWISVDKRLPYSGEEVLVCVCWPKQRRTVDISFVTDEGEWAMGSANGWTITHWMSMPVLPL